MSISHWVKNNTPPLNKHNLKIAARKLIDIGFVFITMALTNHLDWHDMSEIESLAIAVVISVVRMEFIHNEKN